MILALLYSIPYLSHVFPSRPKKWDFEMCNSKSCSVATKLFYNVSILKVVSFTWTTQGLLAKAIISLSSQKNAESDLFIISNLLRSFIAYTLLEDLCLTYQDKCDIWNILVCHINRWRTSLKTLLFLLYHLAHFIRLFTLLERIIYFTFRK